MAQNLNHVIVSAAFVLEIQRPDKSKTHESGPMSEPPCTTRSKYDWLVLFGAVRRENTQTIVLFGIDLSSGMKREIKVLMGARFSQKPI